MVTGVKSTVPLPDPLATRSRPQGVRAGPRVHGPPSRNAHRGDRHRPRLHRLLHQRPHRRPPRRGLRRSRLPRSQHGLGHGRPRLAGCKSAGGKRGPRQDLHRGRLRLARARLQHVPRHEPRHPLTRRALRPPPATATSKAARAAEAAPTSSALRWRRRQPSPATLPTSATGSSTT